MLDQIVNVINKNSLVAPDLKKALGGGSTATASAVPPAFELDQTNKTPVGKILVEVISLKHFPYFHNLYVRLSCNPWVLQTKAIVEDRLEFK